jgi:hypothetical protein
VTALDDKPATMASAMMCAGVSSAAAGVGLSAHYMSLILAEADIVPELDFVVHPVGCQIMEIAHREESIAQEDDPGLLPECHDHYQYRCGHPIACTQPLPPANVCRRGLCCHRRFVALGSSAGVPATGEPVWSRWDYAGERSGPCNQLRPPAPPIAPKFSAATNTSCWFAKTFPVLVNTDPPPPPP